MSTHTFAKTDGAPINVELTIELDEEPGDGNSAPTVLTFRGYNTRTGRDQTVEIYGTWERAAAALALRWAADRLEGRAEEV